MKWVKNQLGAINEAVFGYGSPVAMGMFRIFVGIICFISLAITALDFDAWYTERGYFPVRLSEVWADGVWRLNFLSGVTDTRITAAFYILVMLAAIATALGLWSRISTIVLFLGMVTLHHRSPDILHGGDYLMRAWTFLVMLMPSGNACSVDRLIGLWKGKAPVEHAAVSLWPQRLVQYQLAVVYFTTVWQKSFGYMWWDGTATWYPLHLNEFYRFPLPGFLERQPFIAASTYFTIFIELAMATLVFARPLRKWILLGGVLLHAGIEYRLNIPLFGFVIVSGYIAHYGGDEISAWAKRLGERLKKHRISVWLPAGARFRPGPGAMVEATDALGLVEYGPSKEGEWSAEVGDKPAAPFAGSFVRSVGAWFMLPAPFLWRKILTSALDSQTKVKSSNVEQSVETHV